MRRKPQLNAPLLMPVTALATGILAGFVLGLDKWFAIALMAATSLATLWVKRYPLTQSVTILACFFSLGMSISPNGKEHNIVRLENGHLIRRNTSWQQPNDISKPSHLERARLTASQWRGKLIKRLEADGNSDSDAMAVVAAMTLGEKSGVSKQLRETYSVSGASHVLALSGLHLGIIYMLLTTLTLGRKRFWLSQLIVILSIWAFAFLTGLSTSIVRAAIMITIYSAFAVGGRTNAPLGVLCFTALVMLLTDSSLIFDIGFQLSFMAMAGILLFMPVMRGYVSAKWLQKHRLARWFFGLIAVSIAAQLGTAPLVMYHFGRFPTWFLLTNLVVIPFATAILYSAVLALIIPAATGILICLAKGLNDALAVISRLPLSSINGIHLSIIQVLLMYVIVGIIYTIALRLMPPEKR